MKTPRTIDIFCSVIDNTGDMGFACELIAGIERQYPGLYTFDIWTDTVDKMTQFFTLNNTILPEYRIDTLANFGRYRRPSLAFSLFHAPIPDVGFFTDKSLVLRIDYLSFDVSWIAHDRDEHITSTPYRQIIEVIPSPLLQGSGLIPAYSNIHTRTELARHYKLDEGKKWIPVFVYSNTYENNLIIDSVPAGYEIISFGRENTLDTIKTIPWVDIATWHAIIDESEWVIARGEVSAMAALVRGKLGFWDMYKEIGGLHEAQSDDFLRYTESDKPYSDLHMRLNGVRGTPVSLSELIEYQEWTARHRDQKTPQIKNLLTEIQKCIDSHEFSI